MQALLDEFAALFDLDRPIRGTRLGELVEQALVGIEAKTIPDWGSPGQQDRFESTSGASLDFYYSPHLFPEMDEKLRLAHKLQFHMLPRETPAEAPVSLAAVLESYCHLSGDLFGWEMLTDGRFLIWIVDLSGHGVQSGLASAVLKILIDNLKHRGRVGELTAELNDTFVACLRKDRGNLFATGFFMALASDGSACYTSAGHPPVLVRRADGNLEGLHPNGLPIGMFPERRYPAAETHLATGDTLLLYTDGLVESANDHDEAFGIERVRELLRQDTDSPRVLTETLYRSIEAHQDMARLNDDVTFVAARMGPAR